MYAGNQKNVARKIEKKTISLEASSQIKNEN
jgi:hypothetical protein